MKKFYFLLVCFFYVSVLLSQDTATGEPKPKGWDRIGGKLTTGVIRSIKQNVNLNVSNGSVDTAAYYAAHGFTTGAIDGVKDKISTTNMDATIDHIGTKAAQNLVKMRDSLLHMDDPALSRALLNWAGKLREEFLGAGLDLDVKNLIATILSTDTELRTRKFLRGIIDEGLSPATSKKMADMVDVLGDAGGKQVAKITDTIFNHVQQHLKAQGELIHDAVHPYFVGGVVLTILLLLTAIVLAIVFYSKKKYEKLTDVLTYQIHATPDEKQFNELAERIRLQAKKDGVEIFLRKVLTEKGMLGDKTRQPIGTTQK